MKHRFITPILVIALSVIFAASLNIFLEEKEDITAVKAEAETESISVETTEQTSTATEETIELITPDEIIDEDHILEYDYTSFPFRNSNFVDDNGYEIIKNAYNEFFSDFEMKEISPEIYDLYRKKFKILADDKAPYYDPQKKSDIYPGDEGRFNLSDYSDFGYYSVYSFFDIDGDGTPELCIRPTNTLIFFKYIEDEDRFLLWHKYEGYINTFCTKVIYYYGMHGIIDEALYKLNENGEISEWIDFYLCPINADLKVYLVTMPYRDDSDPRKELDVELQKQGYISQYGGNFYFRVTEEQYFELLNKRFEMSDCRREVEFTYDELFGDL